MKKTIRVIEPTIPLLKKKKRVAAYARVSSGKDAMLMSLSAQVSYYSELIQRNSEWEYAGVYADEATTGTKEDRTNFQKLLKACRNGEIDIVLTKSISRFARNTVTLLEAVRELKKYGVDVYFERENIHSLSGDGELMLTILASFAQEESLSASENQKWRIKKNFEEGKPWTYGMLGYRYNGEYYEVIPEEAEVVRKIFAYYLEGLGYNAICKRLDAEGIVTRNNNKWSQNSVSKILKNYTYTGNLLLQKTFRENHITKKTRVNRGELPKYHAEDTHEAIIDIDTFVAVQNEMARRLKGFEHKSQVQKTYPFTHKMVCGCCGAYYRRKTTKTRVVWICATFNQKGKALCPQSKQLPEETLIALCNDVLSLVEFNEQIFINKVSQIRILDNNRVQFLLSNGKTEERTWKDRSRSESWTDEMKEVARQRTLQRYAPKEVE